jgi:hypothetical protein
VPESETRFQDYTFTAHVFCARAGSQVEIREREMRMRREVRGWRDSFELNVWPL